ncbi:MAG: winged helix-turn-helix domain-containing protein, partial [Alphaproteobacteria bacterium]|nr:winged helix-turn-helix domain-containing protein [Alphaproteobacteria bacterium]
MQETYALGPFRVDARNKLLFHGSEPLRLGQRSIALLLALVERPGAVVSKDALIEAAWPNQAVEESNLTVQITALRRVLGEAPGGDRWIETMPRRGYRYVGPVVTKAASVAAAVPTQDREEGVLRLTASQAEPPAPSESEDSPAAKSGELTAAADPPVSRDTRAVNRFLIAASVVAFIGIAVATWWVWPKENSPTVAVETPAATNRQIEPAVARAPAPGLSFVVLPFANLSNDPSQEYFADAITDDLTTDLSRISGSFVIAPDTAFTYKGRPVDVKQIGRELGVRYVVDGSVRRSTNQVQVNVRLIDTETEAQVWADRFDTDRRNLAEAQGEITGRLARTLHLKLVETAAGRLEQERSGDPDASDFAMRGLAWFYRPRSKATLQEAQRLFESSLDSDPRSVDARIGLAEVLVSSVGDGWSSSARQDEARVERL